MAWWDYQDVKVNVAVLDEMANAVRLARQESKVNKATKVYLDCRARKETEENRETQEKMDSLDMTANRVRTAQLVCPAFPVKWDHAASPAKEVSPVFQGHQESLVVKVRLVLKETLARLEGPVLQDRQVQTALLVHLDRKVY